jgi:conjugal transfer pilus assembly protein TraF
MRRPVLVIATLALASCASDPPGAPATTSPPTVAAPASARPGYDLRVAALPARPAGAAFATAGEEHALVWRNHAQPAPAGWVLRRALASPPIVAGAGAPPLPARVLEVHAAYRRWCAGTAWPGDQVLLASAGGLHLPGALACDPPPPAASGGRPRVLFPASASRSRRRRPGQTRRPDFGAVTVKPCRSSRFLPLVEPPREGVFGLIQRACQTCPKAAWGLATARRGAIPSGWKPSMVPRPDGGRKRSGRVKTPPLTSIANRPPRRKISPGFTGFSALHRLAAMLAMLLWSLSASLAAAAEAPLAARFFGRGADGWFWYETLPPPPPPEAAEPAEPPPPAVAAAPVLPAGPPPLTAAWFRQELERYRDAAIDQPTPLNVRAYLYLQKVMLDKADAFAQASRQAAAGDPYLDAVTERPLSPFAANATSAEATARRAVVLRELAGVSGLLLFVDGQCGVCVRQAQVLLAAQRQYGLALLTVSLDGAAPPGLELPLRPDTGQAARLGVVGTPALFLMRPPDAILPLAQGALDLDTLAERIVAQAHQAGWVDAATYAATRPVRQPFAVPGAGDLESAALDDPALLVASLRERLGLADSAPSDLAPFELPPSEPTPPALA